MIRPTRLLALVGALLLASLPRCRGFQERALDGSTPDLPLQPDTHPPDQETEAEAAPPLPTDFECKEAWSTPQKTVAGCQARTVSPLI